MNIKVKYFFLVNSILALFFGLGFLIVPALLMPLFGFSIASDGPLAFRFFGAVLLGTSILTFGVRNEAPSPARRAVIFNLFVTYILLDIVKLFFCDITNAMIWIMFVIHTIFVVAYGYFLLQPE